MLGAGGIARPRIGTISLRDDHLAANFPKIGNRQHANRGNPLAGLAPARYPIYETLLTQ